MINRTKIVGLCVLVALIASAGVFMRELTPVGASGGTVVFRVSKGDGFRTVAENLSSEGLIRSPLAFEAFAVVDGSAFNIQPGLYRLNPTMSALAVLRAITGKKSEVTVTIPEGSTIYDIDRILSSALVIHPGDLISATSASALEGKLFPDTYKFFTDSSIEDVIQKFITNFGIKAQPLLVADPENATRDLIIASLVQKEVSSSTDQTIVAGIINKRLKAGMPLDIDATICYIKQMKNPTSTAGCYPLSTTDFKAISPYNTYLYKDLPPAPIGNPGVGAIKAALSPKTSPYWYYLSDPKTGETIFAVTLAQQNANIKRYLNQ